MLIFPPVPLRLGRIEPVSIFGDAEAILDAKELLVE